MAVEYQGDSRLKGAFVVLIAGPGGATRQYTIHHPVGVFDSDEVGKSNWVVSKTSQIPELLSRVKDPSLGKLQESRNLALDAKFASMQSKSFKMQNGVLYYAADLKKSRKEYVADARLAEKKDVDRDPNDKITGESMVNYLPEKFRAIEAAFRTWKKSKEAREYAERKIPQTYRTRYPGFPTRGQLRNEYFGTQRTDYDLFDSLVEIFESTEIGSSEEFRDDASKKSSSQKTGRLVLVKESDSAAADA